MTQVDWLSVGVLEGVRGAALAQATDALNGRCEVRDPHGTTTLVPTFVGSDGRVRARVRFTVPGTYLFDFDAVGSPAQVVATAAAPRPATPQVTTDTDRGVLVERSSGRPFLWAADTWWYGLSDRIDTDEFIQLLDQRRNQGFTVIQIVAGLYPETEALAAEAATDGRWPWTGDLETLDPAWWDAADQRIAAIAAAGLVPAIVGAWSYYLLDLGADRIRQHWHEIVARWGALPVVWCVCGEVGLPHYQELSNPDLPTMVDKLVTGWKVITRSVRELDVYDSPVTVHPCPAFQHYTSLDAFGSDTPIDLIWMQTGHADRSSVGNSLRALARARETAPHIPVVNSEVCYEGIAGGSTDVLQRTLFWVHLLSGAAGHTYGAQGLWAFAAGRESDPGRVWGVTNWKTAASLPGGTHVGVGAQLLASHPWWTYEAKQSAVAPSADPEHLFLPYSAGTDDERIVYVPANCLREPQIGVSLELASLRLGELLPGRWSIAIVNPRDGVTVRTYDAEVDEGGTWDVPPAHFGTALPTFEDWLLICRRVEI